MIRRLVTFRTTLLAASIALLSAVLAAAGAFALDESKPSPGCHDVLVVDPAGDGTDTGGAGRSSDSVEIVRTFFKYEPAKGAEATTLNLQVKNLALELPPGSTGLAWIFRWVDTGGTTRFVRALLDYTGGTAFEYGSRDESVETSPRYVPEGDTPGKFFEGPDGVVQLVVPPDLAKPGTTLRSVVAETGIALQVIPSATRAPTRGPFHFYDDTTTKPVTIAECVAAAPAAGAPTAALRVRLMTTSVSSKKAKRGKSLSLKLSASEKVTGLAARVLKGSSTVHGKGSLKELQGSGTLRVKLSKALKKGSYTLELTGSDSAGARRSATATLKVK